ncbi:MAG TPA: 2-dehydro-3-deoxygalactonokinase [Magnetospirillaceae bacterium]|nr:2-dehydro-3-deoxygalactonokinase [Magnetospirillaceae bacterium]
MTQGLFIAGDWGTTRLRLALCDGATILDRKECPGIGALTASPEATFLSLIQDWRHAHGKLPAYLCGMVGSRNGWHEAPYASCPADPRSLRGSALHFTVDGLDIAIVPGLTCSNPLGAPDVMRGEESQILGVILMHPALLRGKHLLALPGTHTKWVALEEGSVQRFMTTPTGEFFALLRAHSQLTKAAPDTQPATPAGFARGVARARATKGRAGLLQTLFETRTRQLIDGMKAEDAVGFLSGLLITGDVDGALDCFGKPDLVHLIGEPGLAALYAEALAGAGVASEIWDGGDCAFAGLRAIFER